MTAYARLVETAARVASTSKRSEKVGLLAELLSTLRPGEVRVAVGLLLGRPRQGRLGVGWATVSRHESSRTELGVGAGSPTRAESSLTEPVALPGSATPTESSLTEPVALPGSATPTESSLTIGEVDEALTSLGAATGAGSQAERERILDGLFARATPAEADHLRHVLLGEMRQGANEGVLVDAVARAAGRPLAAVRRAVMLLGDAGLAAERALAGEPLHGLGLHVLTGVQPMLAATSASVAEALAATGPASVEAKLDGARIQVHRTGAATRVFTRSLREIGAAVPEIVAAVERLPGGDLVLDGEALGLDPDGAPLAFQDTMSNESRLRPFFFDILHAGGRSLIDEPLAVRKQLLAEAVPGELRLASIDDPTAAAAESFAAEVLAAGHEGVMVKALDSPYEAGRRGKAWRKVKPVHTLDLIVLAVEWGSGRRRGWLSNIHLGAADGEGGFVMVGKTFKGMTDEMLRWQTETFQRLAIGSDGHVVHLRPQIVAEIALDGVQRSSRYPGGVALRFARVRRYRPDKGPADVDRLERLVAMLAR